MLIEENRDDFEIDTDGQAFSSLMQLAEYWRKRREERRQLEWRVSLSVWAALLAAAAPTYVKDISIWFLIVAVALLVALHIYFISATWRSSGKQIGLADYFAAQAEQMLFAEGVKQAAKKPDQEEYGFWAFLRHPPCRFQFLATTLLPLFLIVCKLYLQYHIFLNCTTT